MTTKDAFSTEEWNMLLLAPTHAASYIITADMSVVGAMREMKALANAILQQTPPPDAEELVNSLSADIQERTKNREKLETPKVDKDQAGADGREPTRESLRQIAALLDEKCSSKEAAGFKEWLVELAQVVAEADKEGSHFGRGGVQVSDKEKAAMTELKAYIGL